MLEVTMLTIGGKAQRPFFHRNTPADRGVIQQVFVNQDYALERLARATDIQNLYNACVASGRTPLILDAGANIGASAVYFAARFPRARIIAFEPEPGNFALLRRNTEGLEVALRCQALGGVSQRVSIVDPGRGEWGYMTTSQEGGDCEMVAASAVVQQALGEGLFPLIAKVDIEGGEKGLFEPPTEWVSTFPVLIVELHDWMLPGEGVALPFLRCVSALNRDFVLHGENVFSVAHALGLPAA
jgi:FkbM family methyltransferase